MPKYYRVRSQQEWDWLADKLNIYCVKSMACPVIIEHEQGQKDYRIVQYYGGFEPVIEVSQMMEESKMEDYITIKGEDLLKIKNEDNRQSFYAYIDDLFIPANYFKELHIPKSLVQPKVKMTQAEKDEFDDIKKHVTALYNAMVLIFEHRDECINLNNKLFYSAPPKYLNDVQRDFARAWTDESLIEVIPDKKWNVKVPHIENRFYFKHTDGGLKGSSSAYNDDYNQQFTVEELKYYGLEDESIYKRVEVEE